jgi:hypothetical protein
MAQTPTERAGDDCGTAVEPAGVLEQAHQHRIEVTVEVARIARILKRSVGRQHIAFGTDARPGAGRPIRYIVGELLELVG